MATTAITPETLVINTPSADLPDASGTVATAPTEGWVIAAGGLGGDRLVLKFLANGSGDTVTFVQGDRPPSQRAELGATGTAMPTGLDVVLAVDDVRSICVEASRFLQDDGTIHVTCTDAGTMCWATIVPKVA